MRVAAPFLFFLLGVLAACGVDEGAAPPDAPAADSTETAPPRLDYEIILVGAMPDTLRGAAHFGDVVDARSGQTLGVIRFDVGFDFGGGFFLTYGAPQLPGPGQYAVEPFPADSTRDRGVPSGFSARYRRGLLVNLRATDGTLQLDQVNDTLVTGSFDLGLEGQIALPGGTPRQGAVRALGTFKARDTGAGYILGF